MQQIKCIVCVFSLFQTFLMCTCHQSTVFKTLTETNVTLVPLTWSWTEPNAVSCARNCLLTYRSCYSFMYNKQTRRCISGSWLTPSDTSRDLNIEALYTTGALCDKNFTIRTENGFAACLQVFTDKLNYSAARSHCKDIGADLYTMKSREKRIILHNEVNSSGESFWIGLNDFETEGHFVWADDGRALDDTMKMEMFAAGEPNNIFEEDCVVYTPSRTGMEDQNCMWTQNYICELKPSTQL